MYPEGPKLKWGLRYCSWTDEGLVYLKTYAEAFMRDVPHDDGISIEEYQLYFETLKSKVDKESMLQRLDWLASHEENDDHIPLFVQW